MEVYLCCSIKFAFYVSLHKYLFGIELFLIPVRLKHVSNCRKLININPVLININVILAE